MKEISNKFNGLCEWVRDVRFDVTGFPELPASYAFSVGRNMKDNSPNLFV
jgi:hypothetical protein